MLILYGVQFATRTDSMLCPVRIHLAVVHQAQLVSARAWAPLRAGANLSASIDGAPSASAAFDLQDLCMPTDVSVSVKHSAAKSGMTVSM